MPNPSNHINGVMLEWNLLEPLNTELYEAMMDGEEEEAMKLVHQIKFRLLEIQRMYKPEKSNPPSQPKH